MESQLRVSKGSGWKDTDHKEMELFNLKPLRRFPQEYQDLGHFLYLHHSHCQMCGCSYLFVFPVTEGKSTYTSIRSMDI